MNAIDEKIKSMGLQLPPAPIPAGSYLPIVTAGDTAYLSGQLSKHENKVVTGKLGRELTVDEGKYAARLAALNALAVIKEHVGWERVIRVIRMTGYVQVIPDFYEISQVMNGASDLLTEIFGECGRHARSAVGMASLPMNAAVEIEMTLQIQTIGIK